MNRIEEKRSIKERLETLEYKVRLNLKSTSLQYEESMNIIKKFKKDYVVLKHILSDEDLSIAVSVLETSVWNKIEEGKNVTLYCLSFLTSYGGTRGNAYIHAPTKMGARQKFNRFNTNSFVESIIEVEKPIPLCHALM